jgi:hypothetical protein
MKKLLFLLVIITACQRDMVPIKSRSASVALTDVNIGTTANDGTGDPLRTAFQKVNANNALIEAAIATTSTTTEVRGIVNDSLDALKAAALPATSYFWEKVDTVGGSGEDVLVTTTGLNTAIAEIEVGGTSTGITKSLEFIVGTTAGAPANGDSTVYHPAFVDKHTYVWLGTTEDMHRQHYNATARNWITGYRMSNDTVIVKPAFSTGDRVAIQPLDGTEFLTFGTNSLLNGLMAYWKLDDSGSTAEDAHSTNDGTISAGVTTGETGVIVDAFEFNGTSSNVSFGTACRPTEAISISLWFNIADITTGGDRWFVGNGVYSTNWCGYWVSINTTGVINFRLGTNTATLLDKSYESGLDDGSWHHVACTWDGTNAYIYVDNVKSTATAYSSNIVYVSACHLRMGSNAYADGTFYGGLLDEVAILNRALTDAEVATLFGESPYPFE